MDSGELKEIKLSNYKPIKEYTAFDIEEAMEKANELMDKEEWIYLYIECERPLKNSEVRSIKVNKNVIEIIPKINWGDNGEEVLIEEYTPEGILDAFKIFYKKNLNVDADKKTEKIFLKLMGEDK